MKRLLVLAVVTMSGFAMLAQSQKVTDAVESESRPPEKECNQMANSPRKVALVVQNHAARGAEIPFMALTDALTAKLSGCGLQVINPYNAVGFNQNRTSSGEKTPTVSAMELARQLKADGAVTASVLEFLDSTFGTPPVLHQFSILITLNLADAWTGATVCEGVRIEKDSPKFTNNQVSQNRQKCLNDLIYAAADECAATLKKNSEFQKWLKSGNKPSGGLLAQMKADPEVRKWIESMIDGKVSKAEERIDRRLIEVEKQVKKLSEESGRTKTFDDLIDALVKEMMSNSTFAENYKELKEAGDRRPIVVFGKLTNSSEYAKFDVGLKVASERFLKKLYDSKMFDITVDSVKVDLAKRITRRSIVEDESLMSEWKSHNSPDLFVEGEFYFRNELDDTEYFDLIIKMHRLRHPGGVVWFGISTYPVKKGVTK